MPLLASDVMNTSRAVLNDLTIDLYTDTILLPYLKIANDDLSDALTDNGATIQKEVSVDLTLSSGNTTPVLPSDMIIPIEVYEKNKGEDDSFYRFVWPKDYLPNALPSVELTYWAWREQAIVTLGSTQDKVLRVRYYRMLAAIAGVNSPIELVYALSYLAYHTAALASEHIGQNRNKAIDLESVASDKLNKLLKREVKHNQANPTRRRPWRLPRSTVFIK